MLEPRESYVRAELSLADWRDLAPAVQRLRRLLDLDADPIAVDAVLGDDPVLEPFVAKTPGRRAPGAVDPFEIAVRGVVGQQVSVAGARTVTARIVEAAGDVLTVANDRLTHVFPSPDRLAALDPTTLPMPRARGRTITGLAAAVADGSIALDTGADREELVQRLVALPGIGQWTARYTVMRGLGDPDVFLDTDLGVRHALDRLGIGAAVAERWRPWRTVSLWHHSLGNPVKETTMNDTLTMYRTTMPSPVGELTLVADDTALRTISWNADEHGRDQRGPTSSMSPATSTRCWRSPRTSSRSTSTGRAPSSTSRSHPRGLRSSNRRGRCCARSRSDRR